MTGPQNTGDEVTRWGCDHGFDGSEPGPGSIAVWLHVTITSNEMHLYKGSASGTYWYDRGTAGFVALGGLNNAASAVSHISAASRRSPFLSFTTSFAIAREYALPFGYTNPGRVYVIDTDIPAAGLVIVDPVKLLAGSHHHNGDSSLVRDLSANLRPQPAHRAHTGAVLHAPNFQQDLEAVVYALRDSELLVYGVVPRACIIDVIDVS